MNAVIARALGEPRVSRAHLIRLLEKSVELLRAMPDELVVADEVFRRAVAKFGVELP